MQIVPIQNKQSNPGISFSGIKVQNSLVRELLTPEAIKELENFDTSVSSKRCMQFAVEHAESKFFQNFPIFEPFAKIFQNVIRERANEILKSFNNQIDFSVIPVYFFNCFWSEIPAFESCNNFPIKFELKDPRTKTTAMRIESYKNFDVYRIKSDFKLYNSDYFGYSSFGVPVSLDGKSAYSELVDKNSHIKAILKQPQFKQLVKLCENISENYSLNKLEVLNLYEYEDGGCGKFRESI